MCDKFLVKHLLILFQSSIKSSQFPDIWKKSKIILLHKKNDKQLIQNNRPISLLPIFSKIFEKLSSIGFITFI